MNTPSVLEQLMNGAAHARAAPSPAPAAAPSPAPAAAPSPPPARPLTAIERHRARSRARQTRDLRNALNALMVRRDREAERQRRIYRADERVRWTKKAYNVQKRLDAGLPVRPETIERYRPALTLQRAPPRRAEN